MIARQVRSLIDAALRHGFAEQAQRCWPNRLTILTYHRIADPGDSDFVGLPSVVAATPEGFAAQLDLVRSWFDVISLDDLLAYLNDGRRLPPRAALITFDDGYRDNHDAAWPLLRSRALPAVLFVATGCIGSSRPFWWDRAAYAFARSTVNEAVLPLIGPQRLGGGRDHALNRWLAAAKTLPGERVPDAVDALVRSLEVAVPPDLFEHLHLDWDRLRTIAADTFAIGAHTESHPILSRLPLERARDEVRRSRQHLERELGRPVLTFAYPNGGPGDFGPEHERMLREEGFSAGFSLLPGPEGYGSARRRRMRLRRINLTYHDDLMRFAAKLLGVGRLRVF